jgi:hypothetical protein
MALFRRILLGGRALLQKKRVEVELDDELRDYRERAIENKLAAGLSPEEAARSARLEMGSLTAVKEGIRDVGWETRAEAVWQDVLYAIRMMGRMPGLTTTVVLAVCGETVVLTINERVLHLASQRRQS